MPGYDPRRSRPRPSVAPAEEAAPVDALLGPDTTPPEARSSVTETPTADTPTPAGPRPTPASGRGAPKPLLQLAPLALLGALILLVLVLWERRRR